MLDITPELLQTILKTKFQWIIKGVCPYRSKSLRFEIICSMSDERKNDRVTIQMPKQWLIFFAVINLAPCLLLLTISASDLTKKQTHEAPKPDADSTWQVPSEKGPWGDLRVVNIVTEPPEESLVDQLDFPKPTWFFRGYSTNGFSALLHTAGLTPAQEIELKKAAVWGSPGEGCTVLPQDDLVLSLSPESRAALYSALSLFPSNLYQNEPFRFQADIADEWFAKSNVPAKTIALVRRLIYKRGSAILFSDPHLVMPKLGSDLERVKLVKALSRQSTMIVKLHITPDTDIESLVSYWANRNDLGKDVKPLLESEARIPGGFNLDITHLLPRFARKRIYTYPRADGDNGEMLYDCHWNSMNFWNDPPDNRFADKAYVIRTLETDYDSVLDGFKFGDIILFMKSDTEAVHSAVYIADNIVFTKNGPSQHSPWIFMKMDVLTSHYETNVDLKIRGYRKKHAL